MSRPLLLDLYCGAGGAAMGYHRAGFDVIGVDINPQPNYPFRFEQEDALALLKSYNAEYDAMFDAIHASPPCQAYARGHALAQRNAGKQYPNLLGPTRESLEQTGLPWVIENVPGAPMRADFKLCGCQFGLELRRQRWFETSWQGYDLRPSCSHPHPVLSVVGSGHPTWNLENFSHTPTLHDYQAAMGINWMTRKELSQAIPPAYTHYIGAQLLQHLEAAA